MDDANLSKTVRALEERAFNAWPARETIACGGWIFRHSGGYTKRANSANAVEPGASFAGVREAAEAFYARHGLPAVFRLSPLAAPDADRELDAAGYQFFDPSFVARASLDEASPHLSVTIAEQASTSWLDGFATANGVAPALHEVHHSIVRSIALA
ncbi:MAG: GNAT family N-acetyltransferase, partial [Gammaproteobacteria bacterium]|nr:GNAT family N-acetyltransferase [Gammaproteobacteria bacterium]